MQLTIHITDRCNLNCQHCVRDPALVPADFDVSLLPSLLRSARAYGIRRVSLTGGEPPLHPRFDEIVETIAEHGMRWGMVSNGSRMPAVQALLDRKPATRQALDRISFSLDGASERVHDEIRGEGSYREVMQAISLSVASGITFRMQMTVNAKNVDEMDAFALLAADLGAASVSFAPLFPTGTYHDAKLRLSRSAWDRVQDRIVRLGQIVRIPVEAKEGFPTDERFHVCSAWRGGSLHVNVHGRLSLCCNLSGTPSDGTLSDECGDLREVSLTDAHERALDLVAELQRRRVREIRAGTLQRWDEMNCNWCMKQFGKPHWTEDGIGGASAARERWRGIWAGGSNARKAAEGSSRVRLPLLGSDF